LASQGLRHRNTRARRASRVRRGHSRRRSRGAPEGGGTGFVIAHDAEAAGLALVYWWANENEIHASFFASPLDEPAALAPYDGTGFGCVWEMEVLDFERRAWLEHMLKNDDLEGYLAQRAPDTEI
jgi:hypothetical protein